MTGRPWPHAPIGVVVVECDAATVPVRELRERVERLSELGVEVVLDTSKRTEGDSSSLPEVQLRISGSASVVLKQLDQVIANQQDFPSPVTDPAWRIEIEGFDPVREREVESWFTVSNGRIGIRGSLEEGAKLRRGIR